MVKLVRITMILGILIFVELFRGTFRSEIITAVISLRGRGIIL